MRRSILTLALAAFGCAQVSAQTLERDTQQAIEATADCYMMTAADVGTLSCQPPPAMVSAVFGACSKQEGLLRTQLKKQLSLDDVMADSQINKLRAKSMDGIQSLILRSQINGRKCP